MAPINILDYCSARVVPGLSQKNYSYADGSLFTMYDKMVGDSIHRFVSINLSNKVYMLEVFTRSVCGES